VARQSRSRTVAALAAALVVGTVMVTFALPTTPHTTAQPKPRTPPPPTGAAVGPIVEAPARTEPATTLRARPNIVMIMVDDMRADDLRFMPWTRRLLGGQGVRFANSFAPHPLCCPSRASVLTGQYTHNHRVMSVWKPYAFPSLRDQSTLATWLQDAGYATVFLGKYLNGYGGMPEPGRDHGTSLSYVPPGWTDWRASIDYGMDPDDPLAGSTYQYFDTTLSRNGRGFDNYAGSYQSRVYGALTEQIVRERAADAAPYFLWASYTAPHHGGPVEPDDPETVLRDDHEETEFVTPARPDGVKGRFDHRIKAAPGAGWHDPDFSDKPEHLRSLPLINDAERRAMLEVTRQRAEALAVVDQQVRRTVAAVRSSGELGKTLVMFTSDNGYFLGEQRMRQGKIMPHEPSLRTPLLMRGPGIPAGETRTDPITSIDVAPTLAELAGVRPGHRVDGISLLDVARNGDRGWVRPILTESAPMFGIKRDTDERGRPLRDGRRRDVRFAIGVRTHDFLYVDYATGERELYDLARDPNQYDNVVDSPRYADVRRQLRAELQRMRACDGAACAEPLPSELRRLG
jgi:N-acetylglucosamine-6-sulfatase